MKVLERYKNALTRVYTLLHTTLLRESDAKRLPYQLDLPCVKYLKMNLMDDSVSLIVAHILTFFLLYENISGVPAY